MGIMLLTVDFLSVSLHHIQLAESADVKQVHLAITARGSHEVTVRAPIAGIDCRLVRMSARSAQTDVRNGRLTGC